MCTWEQLEDARRRRVDEMMQCANAFRDVAESLFPAVRETPEGSFKRLGVAGSITTCAVNMGFALELYLKALTLQLERKPMHDHDLYNLWTALTKDEREWVEMLYCLYVLREDNTARGSVSISAGHAMPTEWEEPGPNYAMIDAVIQRARKLFVSFRYVFEVTIPDGDLYLIRTFDYLPLLCLCDAIHSEIIARRELELL